MKEDIRKRKSSIKRKIIIVFIFAMLLTTSGIGYLVFTNWFSSAEQTMESMAKNINKNIYNQIASFVQVPEQINRTSYEITKNGLVDLSDETLRDKFFVSVLSSYDEKIYSFSYGTAEGEYYGARRNEDGKIEIMKNNPSTGGNSWYYAVKDDLTTGELIHQAGKFDPRTRPWYQAAEEAGGPTMSPVYKHFVVDDLTISAALPVYDENGKLQGVLGTHMLLSGIGTYLEDIVQDYNGYAVILEKSTGDLVANSIGAENYTLRQDGSLKSTNILDMENTEVKKAYEHYQAELNPFFVCEGENGALFVSTRDFHMDGVDWQVITAIPEGVLMTDVVDNMYLTIGLVLLALVVSLVIYNIATGILMRPINSLLQVAEALSSGDLSQRVKVVRNDEIGNISESLNKVADKMQYLINNLEANVQQRTEELHQTNMILEENKDQLRLILDSAAEAIYGIDVNGNCTFCNQSCLKLLGYSDQQELLGKNMHDQIHHSRVDGTPVNDDECRIYRAIKEKEGISAEDEVFWRADGTSFAVEYHSYPQIKDGEIIGAVITFMDITDRKQKTEAIKYLSCHDNLTGLYNRGCFQDLSAKMDIPDNLPLTIIYADINGLKMTNDVFGHATGDQLIKKTTEILQQCCRDSDVIARVGGDEFIILLPKTDQVTAEKMIARISLSFQDARVAAIKCSISLGFDTKASPDQPLEEIMANAENAMYKDKTINQKSVNKDIMDTMVETLHTRSPREKQHSLAVRELCGKVGATLQLSEPEISKLMRAGYLHDIGKIILDENNLAKDYLAEEEREKMRQHSVVGYRILNLIDDTLDIAEHVYGHHERWDGAGYPRGLKGEQIPLIPRIISIVETYDRVLNRGDLPPAERKKTALAVINNGAGKQFDPQIVELFVQMMGEE
ncbi:MAG: HD domain-containing phosphohydrolase [Desulfitobacterium sp.]